MWSGSPIFGTSDEKDKYQQLVDGRRNNVFDFCFQLNYPNES